MVAEVDRAEGLRGKALDQGRAAFVGGGGKEELVDLGAVLRIVGVQQRVAVENGAQAFHMAFAEEVAAFAHFLHELLERDGLPLAFAPPAHALHRLQHAERTVHLFQHGRAAGAGRGAAFQAVLAAHGW
ncbi:hypothetical protein G6F32_015760 [Rhizopus arrhizus]|nr:hypothetical protein G6F32_015760 [Rhizopus arrhizus]